MVMRQETEPLIQQITLLYDFTVLFIGRRF